MKKAIIFLSVIIILILAIIINIKTSKTKNRFEPQKTAEPINTGMEGVKVSTIVPHERTTIPPQYTQITGCSKNINDIILDYGKEWGIPKTAKVKTSLTEEETNNIISMLVDYSFCMSIAKNTPDYCKMLPIVAQKSCLLKYNKWQTMILVFTKDNKKEEACVSYLTEAMADKNEKDEIEIFRRLERTPKEICAALKLGMDKACDALNLPAKKLKECHNVLPRNENDTSFQDVRKSFRLYKNSVSNGFINCNMIKPSMRFRCEVSTTKNERLCDQYRDKLLLTYCDYLQKLNKKIEEIKEKETKAEMEKEEQKRKLEEQKKLDEIKKKDGEIIKKAKEILQKQKKSAGGNDETE